MFLKATPTTIVISGAQRHHDQVGNANACALVGHE